MRVVLLFLTICSTIFSGESDVMTNPMCRDGFGSQFQTIVYSVVYAEFHNQQFRYIPFVEMEHNYNNDVDFIEKKEWLINFIGNFEINKDLRLNRQISQKEQTQLFEFFEKNVARCADSDSLRKIKSVFRGNKNREDYFDNNVNVAVHIRRHNPHDNRLDGTQTPDDIYLKAIHALRDFYSPKKPVIHIYSQGDEEEFKKTFNGPDIVFHINESIEETFAGMVLADALVTATSSFSYVAGLLSEGTVYYFDHGSSYRHRPLPNWIELHP